LQVLVPARWVQALLGEGRWESVLLAGALGVPLYTCGGSAVPVLTTLLQTGMSPAVALAFLLSGPATRVTALAAVGSLLNRRALVIYVAYVVAGAVIIGLLLG
ncbi:MAG TPA: permease, partial [Anaerolineae bacterium]|nr:permease [Anaerolineae bacterium]